MNFTKRLVAPMANWITICMLALAAPLSIHAAQPAKQPVAQKPTIVLVHGAFAESSSWNGVVSRLHAKGYRVIAAANPLRGVQGDADHVAAILESVNGPVVLVGHSYGGIVISNAAAGNDNVKALVYVAAFTPEVGESAADLSARFPGGTLADALAPPVALPDGGKDLYIDQAKFRAQFAADVSAADGRLMAIAQRPVSEHALHDASGAAAWKSIPSWFVYGKADRNIPEAALAFMAQRAGSKKTIAIDGASHVVMVSHAAEVAALIEQAARAKE